MGEVEAQALRRHQRALLRHMRTEQPPQRRMQQMGRRMIGADPGAPRVVHHEMQRLADGDPPLRDAHLVEPEIVQHLLGVAHLGLDTLGPHPARVADLAAGFGIEGCLAEDDDALLAFRQRLDFLFAADKRAHLALALFRDIADELRAADAFLDVEPQPVQRLLARAGPGGPRPGALFGHGLLEAFAIDAAALGA